MRLPRILCFVALVGCAKNEPKDPPPPASPPAASAPGAAASAAAADGCSPAPFDALLQRYAAGGKIDYGRWKKSKEDLERFDAYLAQIAACDAAALPGLTHYAFWVNAYNAFNIEGVLERFPVQNIKSIDGFLDKRRWRVAKLDLTLNDMEYKQLIPAHRDARAHFAVVCADLGSVPIAPRAYTAANLEETLEKKAREFAADPHNLAVDFAAKRVSTSMLFSPEWYEKDFLGDPRFKGKKAVEYLVPYVDERTGEFLSKGDYAVQYIPWDWSLNGAQESR